MSDDDVRGVGSNAGGVQNGGRVQISLGLSQVAGRKSGCESRAGIEDCSKLVLASAVSAICRHG